MKPTNIDCDIHSISAADLKNYELIDVRETDEINDWPLLKTCLLAGRPCRHVPFSKFPLNKDEFDKNKSYLLFCAKGGRSHFMATALTKEGYRAFSVNNGIASLNAYLKEINS